MPKTRLILRGKRLLEMSGTENAHQLALRSQVSYPTVEKYINRPESIITIDLSVVYSILENGCGMDRDQIAGMIIGDLFDIASE